MLYYTYELIDPRDDNVFYIGKGKNDRMNDVKYKKVLYTDDENKAREMISEDSIAKLSTMEDEKSKLWHYLQNLYKDRDVLQKSISGKIHPNMVGQPNVEGSKKELEVVNRKIKNTRDKHNQLVKNIKMHKSGTPIYGRVRR